MSKIRADQKGMDVPLDRLARYVAIGDSISIDLYPELDLMARGAATPGDGAGAASLLYRNLDSLWPEFEDRDLITHSPTIEHINLCSDGAFTRSVLEVQLPRLPTDDRGRVLVTLTVGGNDLLGLIGTSYEDGAGELKRIIARLHRIVGHVQSKYANLTLIVGTVYDPSDGAAHLGDGIIMRRELEWLGVYNDSVRRLTAETDSLLADIHEHFYGHGLSEEDPARRWYWSESIIEPAARGASEVRRLWLRCLGITP